MRWVRWEDDVVKIERGERSMTEGTHYEEGAGVYSRCRRTERHHTLSSLFSILQHRKRSDVTLIGVNYFRNQM